MSEKEDDTAGLTPSKEDNASGAIQTGKNESVPLDFSISTSYVDAVSLCLAYEVHFICLTVYSFTWPSFL